MSLSKVPGRQWPLIALLEVTFADVIGESGNALGAIDLPGGATCLGGLLSIQEAFNSGTSDSFEVAGAMSLGATNGQAVAATSLVVDGLTTTAPETITLQWTGVGAVPTTGKALLQVMYAINARATEAQPVRP
jgi:hypothetical protein